MRNMSNKMVSVAQDLVPKLPEDAISRVLKCLPLDDAAKLCLVSRSWLCAWKELPALRFDAEFLARVLKSDTPSADKFYNFVSVILLLHVGHISEFYLCVPKLNSSSAPDIGAWISFLSRSNVKEITIKNAHDQSLKLPYHLFSCLNLEMLVVDNCVINLLPFFNVFGNLKRIEFQRVFFMGNSLADFIVKCPALQSLTLLKCQGLEHICIAAPNLKYLTISGKFESVYLRSTENLIGFSIGLEEMVQNYQSAKTCELIAYLAHPCRIRSLSFSEYFFKFLTAGRIRGMFPTCYRYLKSLQLSNIEANDSDEFFSVIGLIKSCPVVEDLTISFSSKDNHHIEHKNAFESCCRLSGLRKVDLTSVTGVKLELKLMKFLLSCSPALEAMLVKVHEKITKVLRSRLSRKLMYYPRASPKARVHYEEMKPC